MTIALYWKMSSFVFRLKLLTASLPTWQEKSSPSLTEALALYASTTSRWMGFATTTACASCAASSVCFSLLLASGETLFYQLLQTFRTLFQRTSLEILGIMCLKLLFCTQYRWIAAVCISLNAWGQTGCLTSGNTVLFDQTIIYFPYC